MPAVKPLTSGNRCPQCGGFQVIIDLYCRISRATDGEGGFVSVAYQEQDGRDAVAEMGCCFLVGEVWKDPALSAWNPKVHRPNFEKMMTRLEQREAQGVWVYDLTRFSRKPIEGERLISIAEIGTRVLSGDSTYDLSRADGKRDFRNAMNTAAHESNKTSERTQRGKRKKAFQRKRSNATVRGFGVDGFLPRPADWQPGDETHPVPREQLEAEQDIIREMAGRLLAGETAERLADEMNERNFRTLRGRPWSGSLLQQKLELPSLCGLLSYKGEIVPDFTLPGPHALTEETWRRLQDLFQSRRRGKPATTYLLSGLIFCGLCGSPLYGRPNTAHKPYPDGEVRRNYWCQKVRHKDRTISGCARLAIDWRYTDMVVARAVVRRLSDGNYASVLARQAAEGQERRGEINSMISSARRTAAAMSEKLGRGELDPEDYDAFLSGHSARLRKLRAELESLEVPAVVRTESSQAAEKWELAVDDLEARRAMVREAFPRLTILPAATRGPKATNLERFDWSGEALAQLSVHVE